MDRPSVPPSKNSMPERSLPPKLSQGVNWQEARNRQMASLVSRLLSHYWTGDDPEQVRRDQIEDWLMDLGKFGPEILSMACGRWRVRETKRPTIGDIHRLCLDEADQRREVDPEFANQVNFDRQQRAERERRRHLEMQLEGRDQINKWAQRKGYRDVDDYAAAKQIHWSDAYREHIREILSGAPMMVGHRIMGASGLGATATEFNPSPERMNRDRAMLGLNDAD